MFATWKVGIIMSMQNLTGPALSQFVNDANLAQSSAFKLQTTIAALRFVAAAALEDFGKAAIQGFGDAAKAAGNYQQVLTLLAQQLHQTLGDPVMESFGRQAIDLSAGASRTVYSMTDIIKAQSELQRSGLTVQQVLRATPGTAYLAELEAARTGDYGNLPGVARNIGAFIRGYGIANPTPGHPYGQVDTFADLVARISSVTHMSAADLSILEQYSGATARSMHIPYDSLLEMYGYLLQQGFKPNTAATSLNQMLMNSIPRSGSTSTRTRAQTSALAMLHLLNISNPEVAKSILGLYETSMSNIGLGVNPATMTSKQQEALARAVLTQSATAAVPGSNAQHLINLFTGVRKQFEAIPGLTTTQADALWTSLVVQAFNVRGARALIGLTQGGSAQYARYTQQIANQDPLSVRMSDLRYQYAMMQHMLPNEMTSILTLLGGVTPGGQMIAGGPLSIMTAIFRSITDFLGKVAAWGAAHPKGMAEIGTLIGVLGIAGLAGAAIFAVGSIIALTKAIGDLGGWSFLSTAMNPFGVLGKGAGAALEGEELAAGAAGGGGISALLAKLGFFFGRKGPGGVMGVMGRMPTRDAAGRFMAGTATKAETGMFGLNWAARIEPFIISIAKLSPMLARVAEMTAMFSMRIFNVIGWITLAVQALQYFHDHPAEIGAFIGRIYGILIKEFLPWMINFWWDLGGKIEAALQSMFMNILGFIWNTVKFIAWAVFHPIQFAKMAASDIQTAWTSGVSAFNAVGSTSTSTNQNVSLVFNVHGTDPKKHAEEVIKQLKKNTGWDIRSSGGNVSHPGVIPASPKLLQSVGL